MKKSISLIMAVCLLLLMTACGAQPSAGHDTSDSLSSVGQEESSASSDISEPSAPAESPSETSEPSENDNEGSVVYFTSDISPEGLMAVYEALGWTPTGRVAVKFSTGEPPASNYLRPELIKDVVDVVNGTIVECNTAYGGSRSETAMHYQVAEDQACIDLVYEQKDGDGASLVQRIESRNGLHTLEHAEEIGLGSRTYDLVNIDE